MSILAMEEKQEEHLRVSHTSSSSASNSNTSMESATVGLVMNTLLTARPRKLQESISRLDSPPKSAPLGVSLEHSLWILHKYIKDEAEKEESLDQVLVPMIEHSLKCKGSKNHNRAMILFNWLFQDELLFQALATNLANIVLRKDDHFIALGWCILARGLVEYEITMNQLLSNGIKEKYNALLKILCSSVTHLLSIVCNGSTLQGGFELPTRLSVAASDFVIALSVALTRKDMVSNIPDKKMKSSNISAPNLRNTLVATAVNKEVKPTSIPSELASDLEMKMQLWRLLDDLIILMQRLLAWNRNSRPLHAKGLDRVLTWLLETKRCYGRCQDEAGSKMVKTGVLLLSSCWKYYGILLHLEDHKNSQHYRELLDQYLSGIEFYADNYAQESSENKDSGIETINFFLSCLLLLLGRLDGKQFESVMSEYGMQISRVLISQLRSADEDVIDGAVYIFKAAMFRTNNSLSGSRLSNTTYLDAVLPSLLHLLDERDGTARAAVMLLAECCSISSDSKCLEEVLKRLANGDVTQRRNAVDVISEVISISLDSAASLSYSMWQEIANHLLEHLGDEDVVIGAQTSKLIPMLDASLVLPSLVHLIYSSNERVQLSASKAFVAVLKNHNLKSDVICMLLDCLSNLSETLDPLKAASDPREGLKLDTDRVLKLIPEWSNSVEDWNVLIGPLVQKMFAEPSNATIVRFLSCISEHLADAAGAVFTHLLLQTRGQKEIDENFFSKREAGTHTEYDSVKRQHSLFGRLCPLLIIRLLPLRVFNDLKSSHVYGQLLNEDSRHDNRYFKINETGSIAELLLNRAFSKFEFEDVRKLAAELCGRIHPQVLFPIISSQLECAVNSHDILKIKASLFSICTSLVVRGPDSLWHPDMLKIRKTIETVLLWPSMDGDELSKAQHGCIDCLALMVCTELQASKSFKVSKTSTAGKNSSGNNASSYEPHAYVVHQLTRDRKELVPSAKFGTENMFEGTLSLSFRLCMANVLISACQKVSENGRKPFAKKILPLLIRSIWVINESEIRAACIQVLFSAVYHLKSAVCSCSSDLLKVAVKSLKDGSEKERMAGAKLTASLMASEDLVLESISSGLVEATTLLSTLTSSDPSPELRQVCQNLLLCMTSI
ncbi:hypothetical protein LguiA_014436 [Lonicera macranthoides]